MYIGKFQDEQTSTNPKGSGKTYEEAGPQTKEVSICLFFENFSTLSIRYYISLSEFCIWYNEETSLERFNSIFIAS